MSKTFLSGNYISQGYYKAFIPSEVNRIWEIDDMHVLRLLSQADRHLGRLDMYSEYVNIDLYISMHIAKEATQSSRIEGTQTHVEEAFLDKEDISIEKRDDWEEVQNYIHAMNVAVNQLHRFPFSGRLIREAHKILLSGVRGAHRMPGEFRTSQNWIGGATLNDAVFVPPPAQEIGRLMSDIEKFANDDENPLPDLLKAAIIHYQFETIHPFLDGNGRVGRLMITLYLVSKGILKQPILYLSDFFEKNKSLYYDNLMRVRTHNDINQWFKFFLTGLIETAKNGISTFDGILQIQKSLDLRLKPFRGRVVDARLIIDELFRNPIINAAKVENIVGKSSVSAYKLIADLEKAGILREITGAQRGRTYIFQDYIELFK
ncbi:Fic family protein [Proteiniphilum acetatigenes]|uniref:Fic family protein n=1 Tax=Proteiniphilum acetatigenes TaxID=294710 RepID=UPI00035CEDE4|nr:Fic family protein [Proteiniphilum acetatigenes]SFL32097.1 Fic family protein [Porphyromonadaceae bacterium KH3CP3RA]